jgi:hypothetical protein
VARIGLPFEEAGATGSLLTRRAMLPVGYPLGPSYPPDATGSIEAAMEIRFGDAFRRLSVARYQAWMVAMEAFDRPRLQAACARQEIPDASGHIDALLLDGLLIELAETPLDNLALLERHRLIPIGFGLGNSLEAPDRYLISQFAPGSEVTVDVRVYLAWALSTRPISIADAARRLGREHGIGPEPILAQLALNLPLLVNSGSALIDTV